MLERIRNWARALRRDAYAVYLVARSPDTPWYVKVLAIVVAAYALSPIDLIPDFIPVLGYLDDLILVPLGIWLVVALIPEQAMAFYRARADEIMRRPHDGKVAAIVIVAIWLSGAVLLCWFVFKHWGSISSFEVFSVDSCGPAQCLVREGNRFVQERNIGVLWSLMRTCVMPDVILGSTPA